MKKQVCLCCNSKNTEEIYKNLHDKKHFVEGTFSLFECGNCKLKFISPLLNEKELSKYYPDDYYSFKKNKLALLYHKLSAYYYSKKNVLLLPLRPLLCKYYISKGKKVLEVGCGMGIQLEVYKSYGLKTFGIEPYGKKLTEREKNLGIVRKSLGKVKYPKDAFNYIILHEVLEHIPNQKQILRKCYKWLKSDGKLIITVPNADGLWEKIFKSNWCGYDIPRHLYNYNPKNISFFLKKFGFKINKIRVFDLPYMLYISLYFTKKNKLFQSVLFKILCVPFSLVISILKKGSLMEVECSKNDN